MKTRLLYLFIFMNIAAFAQWQEVNISGFSQDAGGSNNRIVVDANNNIYIAYRHNSFKLDVIKFDGISWSYVGAPEITTHQVKSGIDINLNSNNIPYVVYTHNNANNQKISVLKYNGNGWELVGNEFFSFGVANNPKIDFDNNDVPYVVFEDFVDNANKLTVMKFNGTGWVLVGNRGFSGTSSYSTIVVDNNNIPYVAFNSTANGNAGKTSVMKFNGNSWEFVGNQGFSTGFSRNHSLAKDSNNKIYVAYSASGTNGGSSNVVKFNGTSWENIGTPGMGFFANEQELFIDKNDNLYLSYTETTTNEIRVHRYDGNNWIQLSSAIGIGNFSDIIKDNSNNIYAVYAGNNSLDLKKITDSVLSTENVEFNSKSLLLFPNPVKSKLTISLKKNESIQKVQLFNAMGQKVLERNNIQSSKLTLDTGKFSGGIYLLKIAMKNGSFSKKIVIQK
ncbi:MAG: T9SS type A sorting domain-containing protein [Flavobacteriaceae bacterium]|nr:T9SS type A sorting domain-containing protein [Flavobacteriaceae bacterium]